MSEIIKIPASAINVFGSSIVGLTIKAAMSIDDMRETVRNIAAVMPGDVWMNLMIEIHGKE